VGPFDLVDSPLQFLNSTIDDPATKAESWTSTPVPWSFGASDIILIVFSTIIIATGSLNGEIPPRVAPNWITRRFTSGFPRSRSAIHFDKYQRDQTLEHWTAHWYNPSPEVSTPDNFGYLLLAAHLFRFSDFSETATLQVLGQNVLNLSSPSPPAAPIS
jgi:hypothetical protein